MEQKSNVHFPTNQIEDSSSSPPQKRAKRQSEESLRQLETTSISTGKTDDNLTGTEHSIHHPTKLDNIATNQPLNNGIFDIFLLSEEECIPTNLEPNSTGLKIWQTREVWHKSLEESHSAQIKERSLLGHLMCSEETQKNSGVR